MVAGAGAAHNTSEREPATSDLKIEQLTYRHNHFPRDSAKPNLFVRLNKLQKANNEHTQSLSRRVQIAGEQGGRFGASRRRDGKRPSCDRRMASSSSPRSEHVSSDIKKQNARKINHCRTTTQEKKNNLRQINSLSSHGTIANG